MKIRRFIGVTFCIATLTGSCLGICVNGATTDNNTFRDKLSKIIALNIGKSDAVITGQNKKIDETNQEVVPFIDGGRTYVPVRFISEGLGATVNWNAANQSIDITNSGVHIKLVVGQKSILVNDKNVEMDAQAMIKGERTFVPVRYIAEALGKNIYYENGLIVISAQDEKIDANVDKSLIGMLRERITIPRGNRQGSNFQQPDLMGAVDSISGNAITLKLIAMSQFNGTRPQSQTNDSGKNSADWQSHTRGQRTTNFTGENKTITVPAGVSITTTIGDRQNRQTKDLQVSDLKAGIIVSIWYSDKESEIISRITVREQND